jgi:Spy/CpxP family protein refolding chaperone
MLGFLIGTACLIGLVKVARWGRHGACAGGACGPGYGFRGHHHHGHGWGHHGGHGERGGRGGGWWMRGLYERLDTTPGQEKVIRQAFDEVMEATRAGRGELDRTRRDVAAAIRAGGVDETAMGELFARHDETLREVRKTFVGALAKVSEALDEEQRKRLADMIERGAGGFGRFGGGPYRSAGGSWA